MEIDINSKTIPKDARWQDLIPKFKCPQCQMYQGSSLSNLERHVILHCKCRPLLIKNHYIRKLKQLSSGDADVLDHVRLLLEAKFLNWKLEGMPEIPLLLRHNENSNPHEKTNSFSQSRLLDLWRLWHQEIDVISLEINPKDILQLMNEAESQELEECPSDLSIMRQEAMIYNDYQLNLELMGRVTLKMKEMQSQMIQMYHDRGEEVDLEALGRLEKEALQALSLNY